MRVSDRHYAEVLTLQARLLENISDVRQYGDNETARSDRAKIVGALTRLALEVAGTSLLNLGRQEVSPELSTSRRSRLFPFLSSWKQMMQIFSSDVTEKSKRWLLASSEIL